MSSEAIAEAFNKSVMPTYAPGLSLVKGQGSRVWDADGKVYLDFAAGISVVNVGHCHPRIVEAIRKQSEQLMHVSNLFYTENQAILAERLNGLALGGKSFFCNSGAEANEGLFKLARLWGHAEGRYEVICMENSFHGRTLATVAATGQDKVKIGFDPLPEGFVHATYNDLASVESLIGDKTVAIHLEAIQGEGGVVPADEEFIKGIRALCDERNLLMLCDEVQCGMARSGNWFGFQGYGVEPDAFALAKALGNGFPIGAVVAGEKLADVFQPGNHATTFGGTPLACAAALATLDVIEMERLVQRASVKGGNFKAKLAEFADRFDHVTEVRGEGFMLGLVLDGPAQPLVDQLTDMGLLSIATAQNVVRLLPPLNTPDDELEEALDMIEDCLGGEDDEAAEDDADGVDEAIPAATTEETS